MAWPPDFSSVWLGHSVKGLRFGQPTGLRSDPSGTAPLRSAALDLSPNRLAGRDFMFS